MFKFFKKDSLIFGVAIGLVLPFAIWGILTIILDVLVNTEILLENRVKDSTLQLIAIFINMFTLRYYLLKVKYDKTGRGVMLATFVLAIIYFVFFFMESNSAV